MIIQIKGKDKIVKTKLTEAMSLAGYNFISSSYKDGHTLYFFTDGNLDIDVENRTINGKRLPGKLFDIAKYFIDNPRIVSKEELEDKFWGDSHVNLASNGGKIVDVTISKVRKCIGIKNIHGVGWILK